MKRLLALPILLSVMTIAGFAGVTVTSPSNGITTQSPVQFVANASSKRPITGMVIYVDSKDVYSTPSASLNTSIAMSSGQHAIVVKAWSSAGRIYTSVLTLQVKAATPPPPTPVQLTSASLANGTVGSGYSATLQAVGGTSPYHWSLASGSLPAGLNFSTGGTIGGTPSVSGNFSFNVQVQDSAASPQVVTRSESISVATGTTSLSISSTSLPSATAGTAYSATLSAKGGKSPYTWSLASGQVPTGLSLSSSGSISGTPSASGNFSSTVEVRDSATPQQSASWSDSISVAAPATLSNTATALPNATAGKPYAATLSAKGGIPPYGWSLASGQMPTGITLSNAGVISGTPTTSGNSAFTTQVKDSATSPQSATQAEGIAVAASSTQVTPPSQAAGYNLRFSDDFATLNKSPDRQGAYNWYEGVWWESVTAPTSDISASNSVLNLNWVKGQAPADASLSGCSQNGLNCHAFRYGYFEANIKWDPTTGAWPAFWLIPVQDPTGADVTNGRRESGELDIFEGQGATPHTFFGTIHDWVNGADTQNNGNSNAFQLASNVDMTQYHTYGVLWVPGKVTWYFDNQAVGSAPTYPIFDVQDYYPVLTNQEGVNWSLGNTSGITQNTMPMSVSWVRVWQN